MMKSSSTTQTNALPFNLDDVMFHAQTTASSLADYGLSSGGGGSNLPAHINPLTRSLTIYAAGLLTSLSPCVWGLLPLTMSYISSAAGERTDKDVLLPTLAYAGGLASVFCTLGLIAATVGGAVYGSTGGTISVASFFICLLMGLQLLELVDLPLLRPSPSSSSSPSAAMPFSPSNKKKSSDDVILIGGNGQILQPNSSSSSNSNSNTNNNENGSLFRTFLLGGSSAIVASPCATPVLTSLLAYVANEPNHTTAVLMLLVYTLGYSTPLLLTAATGGQALVALKGKSDEDNFYGRVLAPWVTPLSGGVL
eukprot:CAMPEP_0113522890 /NCGR_PEP_ID=MMETSP0014_2-20120614/45427_1 /TAXON_ID=2857 /ORGANISM="Nitzschia sp." /LENGTH=308 /DNA_ID=CAMNT_0000420971 /DNA_START=213 /DNA_END=1136 /DNA_ORIENTATION=- /assembly_acc=CAM_ASM_000159